jgi:hypothetical protein
MPKANRIRRSLLHSTSPKTGSLAYDLYDFVRTSNELDNIDPIGIRQHPQIEGALWNKCARPFTACRRIVSYKHSRPEGRHHRISNFVDGGR